MLSFTHPHVFPNLYAFLCSFFFSIQWKIIGSNLRLKYIILCSTERKKVIRVWNYVSKSSVYVAIIAAIELNLFLLPLYYFLLLLLSSFFQFSTCGQAWLFFIDWSTKDQSMPQISNFSALNLKTTNEWNIHINYGRSFIFLSL